MKRLLCLCLIASGLLAQSSGGSMPPMAAVLISPNLPVFAAMPARPNFSAYISVFAQRVAYDYAYEITVNYVDGDKQTHLGRMANCACVATSSDWRQISTIGVRSKPVASVTVAPVTAGTPVPVTLSQ